MFHFIESELVLVGWSMRDNMHTNAVIAAGAGGSASTAYTKGLSI